MASSEDAAATATAAATAATATTPATTAPKVPIPPRGVDYRGKLVLAPMVRSGELPSRLLALHYGADLVWGPETVDYSLIGATRRINPRTNMIEYTRVPSNPHSTASPQQENVIYRLDPVREKGKLIFQLGTSDAARAVAAARFVAADVAGIDVNAGCPKPFSISGGMGAALLRTPDKLAGILEALVRDVTPAFGVGISVKIRLLETPPETEALVRRLVATGITGLTVHCRTTPMRPRERAIRGQLRMIADVCREAGVACLMNGDVESRDQADALVSEFGVDGAMIATAAEKNPSCFRSGALDGWQAVTERYVRTAMEVENRFHNTKYLLAQMVPGKQPVYKELMKCRSHVQVVEAFGFDEEMRQKAREMDRLQALGEFEVKQVKKGKGPAAPQPKGGDNGHKESKKRKREGEEADGESGKRSAEGMAEHAPPAAPVSAAAAATALAV
ncbi:tRNA-dihydrouridine synthase 2 [Madurella fahalii]|uniref:tRNA-dihydrouridine synthase 2 n=1 Tax=Madurella fahalii TaxID=1157608 RepID=A0ABQ0FY25_9PEZI